MKLQAEAWKMPATEPDMVALIRSLNVRVDFCLIEKASARGRPGIPCPVCKRRPTQGVTSTFTFGENFGLLKGMLSAIGIPFEVVSPLKWQRAMGLPTLKSCGDSQTVKKNKHKERAQRLFPHLKIIHAHADALLIAKYALETRFDKLIRPRSAVLGIDVGTSGGFGLITVVAQRERL